MEPQRDDLVALLLHGGEADDRVAVDDGREITYGRLGELSAQYARALLDLGLRPGDRVVAQTGKHLGAIVLFLAVLRAGGVYVPLNPAYTAAETAYFVADAEAALVVCDPARRADAEAASRETGSRVVTLAADGSGELDLAAARQPVEATDHATTRDDLAVILYTSGTTGRSKGAMLTHGNIASNIVVLREAWGYSADDVLLHALPVFHTHGLLVGLGVTLASRARVLLLPTFDRDRVVAELPRATVLMGVPTYYTRLLEAPGLREASRGIRLFVSGSAPLLAATHEQWTRATGFEILERYGMSETTMIASNPLDGARKPGTVGRPLPGVEVRLAAGADGVGGIEVRGPNVFAGYWRMPEKTAAEFTADGWFVTGDLGEFDEDGYLRIVGRQKDVVISGGYNVYPREVELELDALDGVAESAVVGVPDADLGERVVAVVVAEPGARLDPEQLGARLADRLARYKRPARIDVLDELPRNAMGKVQKAALRAAYEEEGRR